VAPGFGQPSRQHAAGRPRAGHDVVVSVVGCGHAFPSILHRANATFTSLSSRPHLSSLLIAPVSPGSPQGTDRWRRGPTLYGRVWRHGPAPNNSARRDNHTIVVSNTAASRSVSLSTGPLRRVRRAKDRPGARQRRGSSALPSSLPRLESARPRL